MLQCRSGKRTGKGAVKIAVDLVNEGLVDTRTAIKMVEPQHLDQLLHPQAWFYLSFHLSRLKIFTHWTVIHIKISKEATALIQEVGGQNISVLRYLLKNKQRYHFVCLVKHKFPSILYLTEFG